MKEKIVIVTVSKGKAGEAGGGGGGGGGGKRVGKKKENKQRDLVRKGGRTTGLLHKMKTTI